MSDRLRPPSNNSAPEPGRHKMTVKEDISGGKKKSDKAKGR